VDAQRFRAGGNRLEERKRMARRAVVTGASSGIGAATVRELRGRGWEVVGVARREDRLTALAEETGMVPFRADLTSAEDVAALRGFLEEGAAISALVNNAGGAFGFASVEASDPEDWRRMFDVNVLAVQRVTSALLPLLRLGVKEAGVADVLTITSIAGHVVYEGGGGYNAAKFAAHALVGVLRLELAGEPIRVVEVAPGMVKTDEFSLVRFGGDQAKADAVYQGVEDPLVAEDIASAIGSTLDLPPHVNIDMLTIKPVAQAAPHKVMRGELRPRD
jgi:NADP-dependent 3-hydroxy acid dehydrogenase YdfG